MTQIDTKVPNNIKFHDIGLSDSNTKTYWENWNMKTLETIVRELKHENRTIDILKIDIEGWEWKALPQMLQSGTMKRVKQLSIEVHYKHNKGMQNLQVLRGLYDAGFRIFMTEHNAVGNNQEEFSRHMQTVYAPLNEVSLINT